MSRRGGGRGGSTKRSRESFTCIRREEQAVGMTSSHDSNSNHFANLTNSVKQFYINRNYLEELYSSLMDLDRQKQCLKKENKLQ